MFDATIVIPELRKLIGWRNHYDAAEVSNLNPALNFSSTGEFYQDYHPALDLKVVNSVRPDNQDIDEYLDQKTNAAILQMVNQILLNQREARVSKGIIKDTELIDSNAHIKDTITGEGRFVGVAIKLLNNIGLKTVIKRFSGHFNTNQTVVFYLFHTSKNAALKTYNLVVDSAPDQSWFDTETIDLMARTKDISGGMYYFGYYEENITGQALGIEHTDWGFSHAHCGSCSKKSNADYSTINNSVKMQPFYCDTFVVGELPAPEDINLSINNTWGINFSLNIVCDYTQFLVDNAMNMKNLIGKSVVYQILKDAQYTQNLNFIEENLRYMITRDLEGAKDTNYVNIADQLEQEMKAIKYDQSSLSRICLSSLTYKTPIYNQA